MAHDYIECTHCGKTEDISMYRNFRHPIVEAMKRDRRCYDCAVWSDWLDNPRSEAIVIGGGLYLATSPIEQPRGMRINLTGFKFFIDISNKEGYACAGLVLQGKIPPLFEEAFPTRYAFISRQDYKTLVKFDAKMCLSKGCFDRYHCLWYRADIAEPVEPWNAIPQNYEVGGEECPGFINKDNIYGAS